METETEIERTKETTPRGKEGEISDVADLFGSVRFFWMDGWMDGWISDSPLLLPPPPFFAVVSRLASRGTHPLALLVDLRDGRPRNRASDGCGRGRARRKKNCVQGRAKKTQLSGSFFRRIVAWISPLSGGKRRNVGSFLPPLSLSLF